VAAVAAFSTLVVALVRPDALAACLSTVEVPPGLAAQGGPLAAGLVAHGVVEFGHAGMGDFFALPVRPGKTI